MSKRKARSVDEISAELEQRKARLADLQTRGDAACSAYDLSMGYNAAFYLESGMIENQIRYIEGQLQSATPQHVQGTLF